MQRLFEFFLVITILFSIIFFLLYKFFFSDFCVDIAKNNNLKSIASCKDSIVCLVGKDIESNNKGEIISWKCSRKRIDIFEFDYYKNGILNFKNNNKNNNGEN